MSDRQILENAMDRNRGSSDMGSAMRWEMGIQKYLVLQPPSRQAQVFIFRYFSSISEYMQQLRFSLKELRDDIEWVGDIGGGGGGGD